jgi:hypothetical protein
VEAADSAKLSERQKALKATSVTSPTVPIEGGETHARTS